MTTDIHNANKKRIGELRAALYDIDAGKLPAQLDGVFAADCDIHLAHPLEQMTGPAELYERAYAPLLHAAPDLERRDFIVMAGDTHGRNWVGCCGHYMGVFEREWLGIPPTQHMMAMRYHEFFCLEDGQITEMQALWDIPQVMMQAGAWAMPPSLAVEWVVPGPASNDGIVAGPRDPAESAASLQWVLDMLIALKRNEESVAAMQLDKYWHPQMMWYGPAGIGSMRRVSGFRNWHQIPFLKAMPDRDAFTDRRSVFFADNNYVGFTAFPGMQMTISGDGWMGIAASGQKITMRSLDFWRMEKGRIRENWVLVDLLDVYAQIGVNVFDRMKELTVARHRHIRV